MLRVRHAGPARGRWAERARRCECERAAGAWRAQPCNVQASKRGGEGQGEGSSPGAIADSRQQPACGVRSG
eukprot:scaffold262396_cov32-Tisochrysis_lutea.AAC.1